ncbi:MAG: DUF523 domain-containing protein [candidate division WOR-3 bacterium]
MTITRKRRNPDRRVALVSACALGIPCRYDGSGKPELSGLLPADLIPVPVCPEQMGGFPTPRPPARLTGGDGRAVLSGNGRVMNQDGQDITAGFIRGAQEVARIARLLGIGEAYLVEKSPSCGVSLTWTDDGLVPGMGVAAAALAAEGVKVMGIG